MIQSIKKRDQQMVPFNTELIRKAIYGAFWENYNNRAAEEKRPMLEKGKPLDDKSEDAIKIVLAQALDLIEEKAPEQVEEVQNLVEMALYRTGHPEVAHLYVVYRVEAAKRRKISEAAKKLKITKSNGEIADYDEVLIKAAAEAACEGIKDVSASYLYSEMERNLYDEIPSLEITEGMLQAAKALVEQEPNYTYVTSRLLLQKLGEEAFGELGFEFKASGIPVNYKGYFQAYIHKAIELELLHEGMKDFDLDQLAQAIQPDRDLLFQYLGMKTLYDRYFIKTKYEVRIELPQAMWMRVAMGLATNQPDKNEAAIRYYGVLSTLRFISSTPTLFNAGTNHQQLSSCYLLTVDDNIEDIFKNFSDNARLSKWAGGIGNDWTNVRGQGAYIKGTNGGSQGGVPWWKLTNDTAVAVNQGSKRKGAICNYLETWHIDLPDFLDMRKNTGDERKRGHDLHTANWIPDLFMKREAEPESTWTLFSPHTVPGLHEAFGAEFEELYVKYEKEMMDGPTTTTTDTNFGMTVRTLPENKHHPAQVLQTKPLWHKMLKALYETGHPWMVFKDPGNIRNPQDHAGRIHSSNLCTEIFLNTAYSTMNPETNEIVECGETAVCNLGSINVAIHIIDGKLNVPMLEETTRIGMEMLDNVIDINFYPITEARKSNMQHRPVGLGIMGFHTAIQKMKVPFESQEAIEFADVLQELIALTAIETSSDMAVSRGIYPSYKGSKWDRSILPLDSVKLIAEHRGEEYTEIDYSCSFPEKWEALKEKIKRQGMRNSNTMAIAPTATIANIAGVSDGINAEIGTLFVKENLSGLFTVLNEVLVERLKELKLWDKETLDEMKLTEGSIQSCENIPEEIKFLFKTAWEINPTYLIQSASRRQKWMDQGQSLNFFLIEPKGSTLSRMYVEAWRAGLKSTYYLRSRGASIREKASVEAKTQRPAQREQELNLATEDEKLACSIEAMRNGEECEACQ